MNIQLIEQNMLDKLMETERELTGLLKASATKMMTLEKVQEQMNSELVDLKIKSMRWQTGGGRAMVTGPEDTSVLNAIRSEVREMRDQSLNLNVIGL